jgi:RNA polymerase sigma factor (sigma-70 family)
MPPRKPQPSIDSSRSIKRLRTSQAIAPPTLFDIAHMRYDQPLRKFILKMIGRNDADDAMQETYMRLLNRDATLASQPAAYIFRVARNVCLDHLNHRHTGVRTIVSTELVERVQDAEAHPSTDELVEVIMSKEMHRSFLDRLPLEQQIAVLLHHRDGMKYEQIARVLDCTERAVERYLWKARTTLCEMIREDNRGHQL